MGEKLATVPRRALPPAFRFNVAPPLPAFLLFLLSLTVSGLLQATTGGAVLTCAGPACDYPLSIHGVCVQAR